MADLLKKLRMLEVEPKKASVSAPVKSCNYHHTTITFPLSLFADPCHASPSVLKSIFGCDFPPAFSRDRILFLDTETTGLSGGVGTVAFQIGVGYFTASRFVVEQFLMHDYPEEGPMLQAVNALMQRFDVLCSFNGRTFDVPLLKSRFLMNRIRDEHFPAVHADVLYPARRIWKLRLKSCRLSHLEEELLGVSREDDLPGHLVPQTYFQYLKDGDFSPLERVLEHNKQDIVSLAQLFFFLCKQVDQPEGIAEGEDLFSLARAMEKSGDRNKAAHCYRLSVTTCMRGPSTNALASMEKRDGHFETAIKLYQTMLRQGDDRVTACEELAKLYEHRLHDPRSAAAYTRQALLILSEPGLFRDKAVQEKQIALQYRYARLRRKLDTSN